MVETQYFGFYLFLSFYNMTHIEVKCIQNLR